MSAHLQRAESLLFPFQNGRPIEDCGDRDLRAGRCGLCWIGSHQEPLSIRRDGVAAQEWRGLLLAQGALEERRGLTRFKTWTAFDWNGHDFSIRGEIVELAPVISPNWFSAAVARDRPFALGRIRKGLHH